MGRELRLSLLVLVLVVSSVFFLGFIGFSSELWTRVALSGAKKVGGKLIVRAIHHSNLWDLLLDRLPYLKRLIGPGI